MNQRCLRRFEVKQKSQSYVVEDPKEQKDENQKDYYSHVTMESSARMLKKSRKSLQKHATIETKKRYEKHTRIGIRKKYVISMQELESRKGMYQLTTC